MRLYQAALLVGLSLQPAAAAEQPYFRFNSQDMFFLPPPPGVGPNDVQGEGDLTVYGPVSVRGRIDVDFALQFVADRPRQGVTWSVLQGALPDGLRLSPSGLLSGRPTTIQDAPGIVVGAVDGAGRQGRTRPFVIEVRQVPSVSMVASTATAAGKPVTLSPTTVDIYGSQSWTLSGSLPAGLRLDARTGTVSGTPEQKGHFGGLVLRVTDSDGAKGASNPFDIDVDSNLTVSGLSKGYVARLAKTMAPIRPLVSGSGGSVLWDLSPSSASLPSGLAIDGATGTISGTPAAEGSYEGIVLRVTDPSDGATLGSPTFGIRVAGAPTASVDAAYAGRVGAQMSFAPVTANVLGDAAWSVAGGLPAGLVLDGSTGRIAGRPGSLGTASGLSLTVTDLFDGETATAGTFSVTGWPALVIDTPDAPAAKVGASFAMAGPSVAGLRGTAVHSLSGTVPPGLSVDRATGAVYGVTTTEGTYPGLVRVVRDTADDATASSRPLTVVVQGPAAVIPFAVSPMAARYAATVDVPFSLVPATTGSTGVVTWSLVGALPAWASFSAQTGAITGTPTEAVSSDPLVLTAQDGPGGKQASSTSFYVDVAPRQALDASMPALVGGVVDAAFSGPQPTARNARGGLTYALATGRVPDGLAFNAASGTFSGTPTTVGDYAGLSLRVRDGSGAEATTNAFTVRIDALATPPSGTPDTTPPGTPAEVARSAWMPSVSGEIGRALAASPTFQGFALPITWTLDQGTLPGWARLDPATGTVLGTPDAVGMTGGLVLLARGADARLARTNAFSLSVVKSPSLSAAMNDVVGAVGRPLRATPSAYGARGSMDWRVSAGTLPRGIDLDVASGALAGTPVDAGASEGIRLSVTDGTGTRAETNPFKVTVVRSALNVSGPTARLRGHAGSPLSSGAPTVTGNLGAVTWSLAGPVPPGMAAAADGRLQGVPTTVGAYEGIAFVARDVDGANGASQPFSVDVVGPVSARMGDRAARLDTAFSATPTASDAVGALSWSKAGGAFPDWMALDPATGTLSGVPAATGTFGGLSLRVRDAGGSEAVTDTFAVTVASTLTADVEATLYQGRVGVPLATAPGRSNGQSGAVTWSAVDGSPPAWVKVDASTGRMSGTPDAVGTASYALQARDSNGYVAKTAPITVVVTAAPTITVGPDQGGRSGAPVTVTPVISGAAGTPSVTVSSGALPGWARLDPATGVITGTPPAVGTTDGLRLTVQDSDRATGTSGAFSIRIRDGISITGLSTPRIVRAGTATTVEQARVQGAAGTVTWNATGFPTGLGMSATGLVTGTPERAGTATVSVTARDASDGAAASFDAAYTVIPALQVTGPQGKVQAHVGPVGSPAPSIVGQRGSVAWSLVAGTAPAWMRVDPATGIVSGTAPAAAVVAGLVLQARDDFDGATARTQPFDVEILPPPAVVNMATNYTARYGFSFTATPPVLQDGVGAATWAWGEGFVPPAWVRLDAGTGVMSGTPDALGSSELLYLVGKDATGATARSVPFRINVYQEPTVSVTGGDVTVRVGTRVTVTPTVSGLAGKATWELVTESGAAAPGLVLDPATGTFGGVPTGPGSGRFHLRVGDGADDSTADSPSFNVTVLPAFTLKVAKSTVGGHAGSFLSTGVPRVDGGVGTVTFTLAPSGSVPAGLRLDDGGILSGIPAGPFRGAFTLTATDSADNATASDGLTLDILGAFGAAMPDGDLRARTGSDIALVAPRPTVLNAYSEGDVRWSLSAGLLPDGVTVDAATGRLRGAPSVTGAFPGIRVQATDADGTTAQTAPFLVQVVGPLGLDLAGATSAVDELAAYDAQARPSGVLGTASWSATGLPDGIGVSTAGRISGTASRGTSALSPYAAVIRLTDSWDGATVTATLPLSVAGVPTFQVAGPVRLPDQALPDAGRCVTVPVTNTGTAAAAAFSAAMATGGDAVALCPAATGACGTALPAGGSCALGLRMAAQTAGEKTATLRIQAATGPPLDVAVSGVAFDDLVADPFTIPSLVDQVPGAVVVSPPVAITGLTGAVGATVSGPGSPLLRVDGGPWSNPVSVSNGQRIEVQVTAPAAGMATQASKVTVGTVSSDFVVQTGDATPNAFAFVPVTGAAGGSAVTSQPATLSGMTVQAPVSVVAGGAYPVRLGINGGTPTTPPPSTVPANATLTLSLDAADGSNGGVRTATVTVGGVAAAWAVTTADTTPDAFAFADVINAPAGQVVTSVPATITGMTDPASVSVTGEGDPQVSVAGGTWGTAATVRPGQAVQVRLTSSPTAGGTPRTATVSVGGVSAGWTVTTVDTVPDAFQFAPMTNQPLSTQVQGAPVTITGISTPSPVTVSGAGSPQVRVGGTGAWAGSALVSAGQTLEVRLTTASADLTPTMATVTVGGVVSMFTATTGRMTPDAFAFQPVTNAQVGTPVTSQAATLSGMTLDAPLSLTAGGAYPVRVGINGATPTTAVPQTVPANARIQLSLDAAPVADGTARTATVSVNGVAATWKVTAVDTIPDAFDFGLMQGQPFNTVIEATPVTVTGITAPATVSVSGAGSPEISVNGGAWTSAATTVGNGQTVSVRLLSDPNPLVTRSATVTIGGVGGGFGVRTQGTDTTPDPFSIPAQSGLTPGALAVSAAVTPVGFDAPVTLSASAAAGGPTVSIAGKAFAASGTLYPGQSFYVRSTVGAYGSASAVTVTAGGTSAVWNLSARAQDSVPDPFSIPSLANQNGNTLVQSAPVQPTGYSDAATVTVTGPGNPQVSVANGAWTTSGTISPGQSLRVQMTTDVADGLTRTATVTVGGVNATFSATTVDSMPDMPWTQSELDNSLTNIAPDCCQCLPGKALQGFTSPVRLGNISCQPEVGPSPGVGYYSRGSFRNIGEFVSTPGFDAALCVHASNLNVANSGTCTYDLGGRSITLKYKTVPTWPNPTRIPQLPFFAGKTPGTMVYTPSVQVFYNLSPSLISVSAPGELEINGNGTWYPGGSQQRLPVGATFRVRAPVPASGTTRIKVFHGEQGQSWNYFDVTPNAPVVGFSPTVNGSLDPMGGNIVGGHWGKGDTVSTGATGNICVPYTSDNPFTALVNSNGSGALLQGFLTSQEGGSVTLGEWKFGGYLCPGEFFTMALYPPSVAGQTVRGTLRFGNAAVPMSYTLGGAGIDGTPDPFTVPNMTGQAGNTLVTSASVTLSGFSTQTQASVTGQGNPQMSLDGGSTWVTSGTAAPGAILRLRLTTGPADGSSYAATATVGGVASTWTVGTADLVADPFAFNPAAGLDPSTFVGSNVVGISGLGSLASVSASGSGSPQFSINAGGLVSSGTVKNGDTLQVFATSSATFGATQPVTVTVGSTQATWSLTTRAQDTTPGAFTIPARTGQAPNSLITSVQVTPTAYLDPAPVAVTGQGTPQVSVNGGPWSSAGTIAPGSYFQVRLQSDTAPGASRKATVSIGGVTADFVVTTDPNAPPDPNAASFPDGMKVRSGATFNVPLTDPGFRVGGWTVTASPADIANLAIVNGALVGTAAEPAGNWLAHTLNATGPGGNTVTSTLTVYPPLGVTKFSDTVSGPVNQQYANYPNLQPKGLVGTATWATTSALPSGLYLDTKTGMFQGTPTEFGSWLVSVRLTDSFDQATVTTSVTLNIVNPSPIQFYRHEATADYFYDWGDTQRGSGQSSQMVIIRNVSGKDIDLQTLTATGDSPDVDAFSFGIGNSGGQNVLVHSGPVGQSSYVGTDTPAYTTGYCGNVLRKDWYCSFPVVFSGSSPGAKSGALSVQTSNGTATIPLRGTSSAFIPAGSMLVTQGGVKNLGATRMLTVRYVMIAGGNAGNTNGPRGGHSGQVAYGDTVTDASGALAVDIGAGAVAQPNSNNTSGNASGIGPYGATNNISRTYIQGASGTQGFASGGAYDISGKGYDGGDGSSQPDIFNGVQYKTVPYSTDPRFGYPTSAIFTKGFKLATPVYAAGGKGHAGLTCGSSQPYSWVWGGSGGGGGLNFMLGAPGSAQTLATTSSPATAGATYVNNLPGQGGEGFGGGGGSGEVQSGGCATSNPRFGTGGNGAAGAVYVEWDAQ